MRSLLIYNLFIEHAVQLGFQCDGPAMKKWFGLVGALCVLGCSGDDGAAGIAATVQHCGGEALAPVLWTRVSQYSVGIPSNDVYVLQLCHPERGCSAVASYKNGSAPVAELQKDRLTFQIPDARFLKTFKDTTWIGDREIPITVIATRSTQDGGSRKSLRGCRTDWELRPYSEPAPRA